LHCIWRPKDSPADRRSLEGDPGVTSACGLEWRGVACLAPGLRAYPVQRALVSCTPMPRVLDGPLSALNAHNAIHAIACISLQAAIRANKSKPRVWMQNPNRTGLRSESEPAEADPIRIRTPSAGADPNPNPEYRNRSESEPRVPKPIRIRTPGGKNESEPRIRTKPRQT
jgi:hypothetical protein